jgi:hypothetical protein
MNFYSAKGEMRARESFSTCVLLLGFEKGVKMSLIIDKASRMLILFITCGTLYQSFSVIRAEAGKML